MSKAGRWWMAERVSEHNAACVAELARYPEPQLDESAELRVALKHMIQSLVALGLSPECAAELCDIADR